MNTSKHVRDLSAASSTMRSLKQGPQALNDEKTYSRLGARLSCLCATKMVESAGMRLLGSLGYAGCWCHVFGFESLLSILDTTYTSFRFGPQVWGLERGCCLWFGVVWVELRL